MKGIKNKKGFTLVELMAAMAIFIIFIGMVGSVFVQGYKILNRTNNYSAIEDEFRNAIMSIEKSVSEAEVGEVVVKNEEISDEEKLLIDINGGEIQYIERKNGDGSNSLLEYKTYVTGQNKVLLNKLERKSEDFLVKVSEVNGIINIEVPSIRKGNDVRRYNYSASININNDKNINLSFNESNSGGDEGGDKPVVPIEYSKFINVTNNVLLGSADSSLVNKFLYGGVASKNGQIIGNESNEKLKNLNLQINERNLNTFIDTLDNYSESCRNKDSNINIDKNIDSSLNFETIGSVYAKEKLISTNNIEIRDRNIIVDGAIDLGWGDNTKNINVYNSIIILEGKFFSGYPMNVNLYDSKIIVKGNLEIYKNFIMENCNNTFISVNENLDVRKTKFLSVSNNSYIEVNGGFIAYELEMDLEDSYIEVGLDLKPKNTEIKLKNNSEINIKGAFDNNNTNLIVDMNNSCIHIGSYLKCGLDSNISLANNSNIKIRNNMEISGKEFILNLNNSGLSIGEEFSSSCPISLLLNNNSNIQVKGKMNMNNNFCNIKLDRSTIIVGGLVEMRAFKIDLNSGILLLLEGISNNSNSAEMVLNESIIIAKEKFFVNSNLDVSLLNSAIVTLCDMNIPNNAKLKDNSKSFILVSGDFNVNAGLFVSDTNNKVLDSNTVIRALNYFLASN